MILSEETPQQVQDSLLAICLFAAFADGDKSDAEREEVRRLAEEIGSENLAGISLKILMRKLPLSEVAAGLTSSNDRLLGYEMALAVCQVSGDVSAEERAFLDTLRQLLALSPKEADEVKKQVDEMAYTPSTSIIAGPPALPALADVPDNQSMILKYAILNGALELLPETMATIAIIPMQMKMVYRIGKSHGVELSRAHIGEFLATAGIGMGSQVVEGFARKLMRGFGKKVGGRIGGRAADQLTGSTFSFATTFALGKVAEVYYSGGRTLAFGKVKELYAPLKQEAETLHPKYLPEMQAKLKDLTPGKIFSMVRGSEVP